MQTKAIAQRGCLTVADPHVFRTGRQALASFLIWDLIAGTVVRTAQIGLETALQHFDWTHIDYPPDFGESPRKERLRLPFERPWFVWMTHHLAGGPLVLRACQTQADRVCIRVVIAPNGGP